MNHVRVLNHTYTHTHTHTKISVAHPPALSSAAEVLLKILKIPARQRPPRVSQKASKKKEWGPLGRILFILHQVHQLPPLLSPFSTAVP